MDIEGQTIFKNEPFFTNRALAKVACFKANLGGTEILNPLSIAKELMMKDEKLKHSRIFLLTDGEVKNRDDVMSAAKTGNPEIRIHTFGIGGACDKEMVTKMAQRGRGSVSLIDNPAIIEKKVIRALRVATEPSLKKCTLQFGDEEIKIGEVFRHQIYSKSKIMDEAEFKTFQVKFACKEHPITK